MFVRSKYFLYYMYTYSQCSMSQKIKLSHVICSVFIGKIYCLALIWELVYAMFVELVKAVMSVRSKYTPRNNLDVDFFFTYRLYWWTWSRPTKHVVKLLNYLGTPFSFTFQDSRSNWDDATIKSASSVSALHCSDCFLKSMTKVSSNWGCVPEFCCMQEHLKCLP